MPLSLQELKTHSQLPSKIEEAVFKGFYPVVYSEQISPERVYANYIKTYIKRDVRTIKNEEILLNPLLLVIYANNITIKIKIQAFIFGETLQETK